MSERLERTAVLERLRTARGFLFDLDGTLVLGDRRNHGLRPLPGAVEITRWLAGRGVPFVLFTNGTVRTPREYVRTLGAIGFELDAPAMLTPASSAAAVCARRGHRRVLVLGNEGLAEPLREAGVETVAPGGENPASGGETRVDAVVAGWYPEFTMADLESACHAVESGARLYSCSQAAWFATADGRAMGTSRAICAMIKSQTGARVEVVGKPSLYALGTAARRLGARVKDLAVVGDDPKLEVPMALRGRALAIGVGSGIAGVDAFEGLPAAQRPHLSVSGVDELLPLLAAGSGSVDMGG
jgi:HAD superfamily hydrolase (TIGR01450 family)